MRILRPTRLLLLAVAISVTAALPALGAPPVGPVGAAASYAGTHFGKGNLPAGCMNDRDVSNPDNNCFHMKVGLNALDSPEVNVAVLVPLSPAAERDMRMMRQAVEAWAGGIHTLSDQMNLKWLRDGVRFHVTTHIVPVGGDGLPTQAIRLASPKIVVIATNPVGGIGIGIDPLYFANALELTDGSGAPCTSIPNPFSMSAWQKRPGFDAHHGDLGGIYVKECSGTGGNICFSVNGAIDPVPGKTDFFSIYDLVTHETGHCLTLGHVGDGADGPWGPTPTNDIMAYSSDPPGLAKCVSTLDVEGFALQMSKYLDVNGDGKVDAKDALTPNDPVGDGLNSFQVQNPLDHRYATATGEPADCPQPDYGTIPGPPTNWEPTLVSTTKPKLTIGSTRASAGHLSWAGTAEWVSKAPAVTRTKVAVQDKVGDGTAPATDITAFTATVTPTAVKAVVHVNQLWPTTQGGRTTAYSVFISGRRFDSFVTTQGTSSDIQTIDSGARHIMPPGTSVWDTAAGTVSFTIPRIYLADARIRAPYAVAAETGVHIRTKDWVSTLDLAPDSGTVGLTGPKMTEPKRDAPLAKTATTKTVTLTHEGGNSFTPADTSDEGVPLVPAVGNTHEIPLPITKQSTVTVTVAWDDPASFLGLAVNGGSGQIVKDGSQSVSVTVPWAHRELAIRVIPSQIFASKVNYTLTAKITTLVADKDRDGVPDVGDLCADKPGPAGAAGCPDSDDDGHLDSYDACPKVAGLGVNGCPTAGNDKVIAFIDGKRVGSTYVMTRHRYYDFTGSASVKPGKHTLKLVWFAAGKEIKNVAHTVTVR